LWEPLIITGSTNAERFMAIDLSFPCLIRLSPWFFILDFWLIRVKKVEAYISVISSWAKIPNIGFDRAESALQNPLSH
jgi:hypothetical protein